MHMCILKRNQYFIYRLASSQPGYVRKGSPRDYREDKRETKENWLEPSQEKPSVSALPASNGSGNGGRMHPSYRMHRLHRCNNGKSVFLTSPFFFPRPVLLANVTRLCLFLFLCWVTRASGPISSWTSHHSITLSMPVRPCLSRVRVHISDTRVVVPLMIVHQFQLVGFDHRIRTLSARCNCARCTDLVRSGASSTEKSKYLMISQLTVY